MRVSFDLDEVLFVSPETHKTEPPLPFPLRLIYKERLRLGAPALLRELRSLGYEVWIYTSSYRTEKYIRGLFRCYGVKLDGIVNAQRHLQAGLLKLTDNQLSLTKEGLFVSDMIMSDLMLV